MLKEATRRIPSPKAKCPARAQGSWVLLQSSSNLGTVWACRQAQTGHLLKSLGREGLGAFPFGESGQSTENWAPWTNKVGPCGLARMPRPASLAVQVGAGPAIGRLVLALTSRSAWQMQAERLRAKGRRGLADLGGQSADKH